MIQGRTEALTKKINAQTERMKLSTFCCQCESAFDRWKSGRAGLRWLRWYHFHKVKKLPSFAAFDILFAASEPEYQTGKEKNKTDSFLVQAFYCNHFKDIHYFIPFLLNNILKL